MHLTDTQQVHKLKNTTKITVRNRATHLITTARPPVFSKALRIALEEPRLTENEFEHVVY